MRRIIRTSHEQKRRTSLKADEENLLNFTERRNSMNNSMPTKEEDKRRKSLPPYAFFSGHNNPPNSSTYTARKRLRRFLTIRDDAYESKYLVTVVVIGTVILFIVIISLYQLLIDQSIQVVLFYEGYIDFFHVLTGKVIGFSLSIIQLNKPFMRLC